MGIAVYPVPPQIFSNNTSVTVKTSTPASVQQDDRQYDDDGYPYFNPNVPGADIATGDRQNQILAQLQAIAAVTPDPVSAVYTTSFTGISIFGPFLLTGANRLAIMQSGTYSGLTVGTEVSNDNLNWTGIRPHRPITAFVESGPTYALGANATQANIVDVGGWVYFRYKTIAYTSGVLNVTIAATAFASNSMVNAIVSGTAAEGVAGTSTPVRVAGTDGGGLIRTLSTDASGQVNVNQGAAGVTPWLMSGAVTISGTVPVTGSLTTTPSTLPTVTQDDDKSYDDDGIPFVNPNVPGADIATGDRQNQIIAWLQSVATITPPMGVPNLIVGQITAAQQVVGPVLLNGLNMVQVFMNGTYTSATMIWEVSQDGRLWRSKRGTRDTGLQDNIAGIALGVNATAASTIDVSGWLYFRARCNAYGAAGILNITLASYSAFTAPAIAATVGGVNAIGTAATGNPITVAGQDPNGFSQFLAVDSNGQLIVDQGVAGATAWPVSMAAPPTGAAIENAGQIQRQADLLEAILIELRVLTTLVSQQSQPSVDDAEKLRSDINLSIN